jgi:Sulfotransferase domain
MKLIGAGLPRTATLTQKIALEMLGVGPCYHMVNVLGNLDLVPLWRDALEGKPDWTTIFNGHQSTVDWPGSYYYKELLETYPDAKVLLSVRDPAAWERSMRDTIIPLFVGDSFMRSISTAAAQINPKWQAYLDMMREMWISFGVIEPAGVERPDFAQAIVRHTEDVRANVPADQLLVWEPRDGWEPLCEFLESPVPEAPLPHVNDTGTFIARVTDMSIGMVNGWWEEERPAELG